jgi:hypothetical protein
MANNLAMAPLLDTGRPVRPLVRRAKAHSGAVMDALKIRSDLVPHRKALAKELVQAYACFVDLLAAGFQVEQVQPLVDSTKAVMDAMVTDGLAGFDSACEQMRLALIAWGDRNGWND